MHFIEGKKVSLREVEESDLVIFKQLRNNYTDSKSYRSIQPLTSEKQKWYWMNIINSPNHIVFTIIDKTNKVIGEIRCSNIVREYQKGELGLFIDPLCRGKGMASEALNLFLEYLFGRANINRIEAQIVIDNSDSLVFFRRNKFFQEGVLRDGTYSDMKYKDIIIMSMLKSDWIRIIDNIKLDNNYK